MSRCPSSSPPCTATLTQTRRPRPTKLSEPPPRVHPGSPPKFHETWDNLLVADVDDEQGYGKASDRVPQTVTSRDEDQSDQGSG